jgi:hypothetical protein
MEQAPTMRLRPLVIALAGWTAFQGLSIAAETPARPPGREDASQSPTQAGAGRGDSLHPTYFGVMGEVSHPGTYEASGTLTLAELVKRAGGVTPRANRTVRIFRGGVLTEQVYLGSGEDPALLPGDLVVIAASASEGPHITPTDPTRPLNETAGVFAVQIAFVNLIERPVIAKMPSDQATVSRIVELLGQSSDCASKIRVFNLRGIGPGESETSDQITRPLESGTVLVFPSSSVRTASLPALPAPIGVAPSSAPPAVAIRLPEFKAEEASPGQNAAVVHPLQHKVHLTIEGDETPVSLGDARSLDIAPQFDVEPGIRLFATRAKPDVGAAVRSTLADDPSGSPSDPHPGRTVAIMAAMSAVAGAAMLLTIISIVQRWLQSGKSPLRRLWNGSSKSAAQSSTAVISIPPISTGNIARRPLRIDASQPITRLSVDLAAIERVTHAKSGR